MPHPNTGSRNLSESIISGQPLEARGEALRSQHEAGVGNISNRINRIRSAANLATQREGSHTFGGGPRGFSRQLTQATRRGKARQSINNRGELAVKNQQLKDRVSVARSSLNRRGKLIQSASDAARLKAGQDVGLRRVSDQVDIARSGMIGAIAGGAARGFKDIFNTGKLGQGIMDQQREVDNFFSTFDSGEDPDNTGLGFEPSFQGSFS